MSGKLNVKDRVVLRENNTIRGMIVSDLGRGKYKVLWDRDWQTGRVFIHNHEEITLVN